MGTAAPHTHGAAAKVSSTSPAAEMGATAATAEVSAAASTAAAKMSTTATATIAASRVSGSRQAKGQAYCGHACRDFPHDTPRQGQMRQANARSPGPFRSGVMLQCTHVHFAHP